MIIRLEPEQIAGFWDILKFGIAKAARTDLIVNGESLNNVLKNLLSGQSQAWLVFQDLENGRDILGIVVTYIGIDGMSETRNLIVYALYGFKPAEDAIWIESIEKLGIFARDNNCQNLIGYTTSELLRDKLSGYGFQTLFNVIGKSV